MMILLFLIAAFSKNTNEIYQTNLPIFSGMQVKISDLIFILAAAVGLFWNIQNVVIGFIAAKSKLTAIKYLFPYLGFLGMLYFASYSQFYQDQTALFVVLANFFFAYFTTYVCLSTMAKFSIHWFVEPIVFAAILYLDANKLMKS
jgi:lipid-A-disaccharide synthase-like uncharacterized protein